MEKVYIQVKELLTAYNVPFSELMELVKADTLAFYEKIAFDYVKIDSFDSYIDAYIAKERDRIERQYIQGISNIKFPNERTSHAREILSNRYNGWKYDGQVRQFGVGEIIEQRRNKAIKSLDDREQVAKHLAFYFYIKSSEYENTKNKPQAGKGGRKQDTGRIESTEKAFREVENLYKETLASMDKDRVFEVVSEHMNFEEPHKATFNRLYRESIYTRGAGNPHKNRKPA